MTAAETRAANQLIRIKESVQFALDHGWERIASSPGVLTLRRQSNHQTPVRTPKNWWPGESYTALEFVSLIGTSSAIYRTARVPWIAASDRPISIKRALEILRDPELSEIHRDRPSGNTPQNEPASTPVTPVPDVRSVEPMPPAVARSVQTRCIGFTAVPRIGECGAHILARSIAAAVIDLGHVLRSAAYAEWKAFPARENLSEPVPEGSALTLVTEFGWVSLVSNSSGRLPRWTLTTDRSTPTEVDLGAPYSWTAPEQIARLAYAVHRSCTHR